MAYNRSVRLHSFLCGALGVVLPALFVLSLMANTVSREQLDELLGEGPARSVSILAVRPQTGRAVFCHDATPLKMCLMHLLSQGVVTYLWEWIPEDGQVVFVILFGAFCYLLFFLAKYFAG